MKKKFDLVFLVDSGIGNAIQTLYSLEYLLRLKVDAAIFLGGINHSFQNYLRTCYGDAILGSIEDVQSKHLIHGFTYQKTAFPSYEYYYYVNADFHAAQHASETEQFLHLVKGIYPGGEVVEHLQMLKGSESEEIKNLKAANKVVLYPGGSSVNSAKRWPHFKALMKKIGVDQTIIIGGKDDLNFEMSYVYPNWLASFLPQSILNQKTLWKFFKKIGLLKKHAHWNGLEQLPNSYIEQFSWAELAALFKSAKQFIGNDGGLMHLAAAVGLSGKVFYGPTSSKKNKPFFSKMEVITSDLSCSPCQFGVGGIQMTKEYINCPFNVACLRNISIDTVS
ncbi:MAG: glycosyltransferase family 9 protein [Vicingaceae bacterium]